MRVDFYLLESGGPELALAPLAAKVLETGGRLLVVAAEAGQREALSRALWSYRPESFLANGLAGGEADARQPILIADGLTPANGARYLALADGVWREPGEGDFERILLVFGEAGRMAARETWRLLKGRAGWDCRFWRREGGRWIQAG